MFQRLRLFLVFFAPVLSGWSQQPASKEMPEYYRKEEILLYGKRYRIHNNYLSFGPGFISSTLRSTSQKGLGVDFNFHIRRQYFQVGALMSGETVGSNNHLQAHICYGYRKETKTSNLAFYAGPNYYSGVVTQSDPLLGIYPSYYTGYGVYACAQGIYKLAFDIGIGGEVFAELSSRQNMFGFKLIAFFSGAYVGKKKNYNPNVRAERKT